MNLEQLRIFLAVAEHRSFTKAAETLYISHSTTSRNVASLEEELGVQLLVRDKRSVRLSQAGEILLREGGKLLKKIEAVEDSVRSAGRGLPGSLTIAGVCASSTELLGGYRRFRDAYPGIELSVYYWDVADLWRLVSIGEADVGFSFASYLPQSLGWIDTFVISREKFCVVAPMEHPLALRKTVKLAELKTSAFVPTDLPELKDLISHVRSGGGIALVPVQTARDNGAGCAVLDLEDLDSGSELVMFWRRDNASASIPMFVDIMKSQGKQ